MAISRAQLAKELEPGLNALFGMSYDSYDQEYEDIFVIGDKALNLIAQTKVSVLDIPTTQSR